MTKRLYYDDSHIRQFTAKIIERTTVNNQPALVLDETYFYPTGGGQPHDSGTINGVQVLDVVSDDRGEVLHIMSAEVAGDEANCEIDWSRRFDHMQHHSGQHLLTQAFVQVTNAQTVGFHLSDDSVTIDLDRLDLSDKIIHEVESLANAIVFENRPVTAKIVNPSEIDDVRMRKMPEKIYTDGLRIIEIEDFDRTACGGTHVRAAGEIGLIKVIKTEKRGDKTRVEFRCGIRALSDYESKNSIVSALSSLLTCHQAELVVAVSRLHDDLKQTLRTLKQVNNTLLDYEVPALLADAKPTDEIRIISKAYDGRDSDDIRGLATRLTEHDDVVVLIGTAGEKSHLVFARSENVSIDMNALLKASLEQLGNGRGGGRPNMAQGGGVPTTLSLLESVLEQAVSTVMAN